MSLKSHGVTKDTPKDIMLSAGAYYKNLHYNKEAVTGEKPEPQGWNGDILGATSGGGKVSITPEYLQLEVDGATVRVKGMTQKVGETATFEVNIAEISEGIIKDALHLVEDDTVDIIGYKKYVSKPRLEDTDYLDNIAFVGTKADGQQIIIIFNNAICLGALELEPKNKEQATYTIQFECTASFEQDDLEHLPYEIYYPQVTV